MRQFLAVGLTLGVVAASLGCVSRPPTDEVREASISLVNIEQDAVQRINADLVPGPLTMDVGIVIPSNLDESFGLVSVEQMLDGIRSAKEIFGAVGVQIRLIWVKTGPVPEEQLSIVAMPPLTEPGSKHTGLYIDFKRNPRRLSEEARTTFDALLPRSEDSHRTIYLVVLQDVFYPFLAPAEAAGDFVPTITATSGFSFPPYLFGSEIPRHLRGVITISNLTAGTNRFKTIAHEIGHKTLNVSHESGQIDPEFEVIGDQGLMIYGSGTGIPSGKPGRYHRERLERSPFLYRQDEEGRKTWNPDFEEGGHYFDPIYETFVVPGS